MRPPLLNSITRITSRHAQSGQAIVLIALMMVGLIGMTGLALDGGSMLLADRRAQKVAEMAAMSAAARLCNNGTQAEAIAAAQTVANANEISNMPNPTFTSSADGTDISVTVQIPKNPYFIHLVYQGPLVAEGRSTTRCAETASSFGDVILYATSQTCTQTLHVSLGGSRGGFEGSFWSNGEADLSSGLPASVVTGTVDYIDDPIEGLSGGTFGGVYVEGLATWKVGPYPLFPHPDNMAGWNHRNEPHEIPDLFNIEDWRPGGPIHQLVGDANYHIIPPIYGSPYFYQDAAYGVTPEQLGYRQYDFSNTDPTYNPYHYTYFPRSGVIYVPGHLGGYGAMPDGANVTVVTEGKINTDGAFTITAPYIEGLALFSNYGVNGRDPEDISLAADACGNGDVIKLSAGGETLSWAGLIYGPGGNVHLTLTNAAGFEGAIIANTIGLHGSNIEMKSGFLPESEGNPEIYYVQ